MIDYVKLKQVHELARELSFIKAIHIDIQQQISLTDCMYKLEYGREACEYIWLTSLDDLIAKLKELILSQCMCKCGNTLKQARSVCDECIERAVKSVEPKFKLGQEVWFNEGDHIISFIVETRWRDSKSGTYRYADDTNNDGNHDVDERHLYPSRQALIESQVEYWNGLLVKRYNDATMKSMDEFYKSMDKRHALYQVRMRCDHVGDPRLYASSPRFSMCVKCGDLFR